MREEHICNISVLQTHFFENLGSHKEENKDSSRLGYDAL
jgi:hypothetical protein